MIPHFDIIKLTADGLLVVSVLILGIRYLRSSTKAHTTELMILEASLKGLIRDADGAARSLNDELGKRQRDLERLLLDIETSEKRTADAARSASETAIQIDAKLKVARGTVEDLHRETARPIMRPQSVSGIQLEEEMPEPPSFDAVVQRRPTPPRSEGVVARTNIYGEPLTASERAGIPVVTDRDENPAMPAESRPIIQRQRLTASIERETHRSPPPSADSVATTMRTVFGAAEDMLRAGKDVEVVAAVTQLPIDRVVEIADGIISQQREMRGERAPEASQAMTPKQAADPRLGVLGSMRRQTQVL